MDRVHSQWTAFALHRSPPMRGGWKIQAGLAFLTVCGWSTAEPGKGSDFTYEALRDLIGEKKIRRIDDLVPLLPKKLRDDYVLMFETQSAQGASAEQPRVILFGEDAKLLLAFTGDAKQTRGNRLEVIQWREKERRFDFKEVVFEEDGKKAPHFVEKPDSCKTCHREDLRPNWEAYNLWRGSYFGVDNYIPKDTAEYVAFHKYRKQSEGKGRYAALGPSHEPEQEDDNAIRGLDQNRFFSARVFELNRQRLARKLQSHPQYAAFRYAVLAAALGCSDLKDFLPEALARQMPVSVESAYTETKKHMEAELAHRLEEGKAYKNGGIPPTVLELNEKTYDHLRLIVGLRWLMENLGMSTKDWATNFDGKFLSFYDGTGPAIEWLAPVLAKDLLETDKDLADVLPVKHGRMFSRVQGLDFTEEPKDVRKKACPLLKKKSLAALANTTLARPLAPAPRPILPTHR